MIRSSYNLGTIWGIPIKLHISLAIILPILAFQFQSFAIPILLFASIALHELGHCYFAKRQGAYISEIMLMMLGGAAKIGNMSKRPLDEIKMAIAGPIVSLVLGFALLYLAPLTPDFAYRAIFITGIINISLGIFNLIPAFPMDGGRVLRACLAQKKGQLEATRIATKIGQFIAILMGVYGLFNGEFLLVIIAIYINYSAKSEYRMVQMQNGASRFGGSIFEILNSGSFNFGGFSNTSSQKSEESSVGGEKSVSGDATPPPYARKK